MQKIEYRTLDKASWPNGPWKTEPDKIQWHDGRFPCLAVRNHLGAWCGYVGVSREHPLHGVSYSDAEEHKDFNISVHGGLSYSDFCQKDASDDKAICHVVEDGEDDEDDYVWWFGFDCAHSGDFAPGMMADLFGIFASGAYRDFAFSGNYRDLAYVQQEIARLSSQLAGEKDA